MILLLTSDLNGNRHWYEWLVRQSYRIDAICIAGDLTNPFHGEIQAQREMVEFAAWRIGGQRVDLFACEGDQDLWGSRWFWLKSLAGTRRLGDVTVTSVPWKCADPAWFDTPSRWRRETANSWLVLEHEPPRDTAVGAGAITRLLEDSPAMDFAPDFVLSGHMRFAPWLPGGSWWDRRGRTFVFNAGFDPDGAFPCHILLDTVKREAIWKHLHGHERIRLDSFSGPFGERSTNGGREPVALHH